jgi:hypothetical protein
MQWRSRLLVLVLVVLVSAAGQSGDDSADDLEQNARLLRKWRTDPEHYARLQRDLRAFHALPLERQKHLRRFDLELHNREPQEQRRLWDVLERYSLWYERLPEDKRKSLDEAADVDEKLELIREIREQQWLDRLPQRTRAELDAKTAGRLAEERADLIRKSKAEEKLRHQKMRQQFETKPAAKDKAARPAKIDAQLPDGQAFAEK